MKIFKIFQLKIVLCKFYILAVKNCSILHGHVFVMIVSRAYTLFLEPALGFLDYMYSIHIYIAVFNVLNRSLV